MFFNYLKLWAYCSVATHLTKLSPGPYSHLLHNHLMNVSSKYLAEIQVCYSSKNLLTSQSRNMSDKEVIVPWFVVNEPILTYSDHCFVSQVLLFITIHFDNCPLVHFKFWNYIKLIYFLVSLPAYLDRFSIALSCSINILHGFLYCRKFTYSFKEDCHNVHIESSEH